MNMQKFEIRYKYETNYKIIRADTRESAERMYLKIIKFAKTHYKPIHGGIELWDRGWLVKSESF